MSVSIMHNELIPYYDNPTYAIDETIIYQPKSKSIVQTYNKDLFAKPNLTSNSKYKHLNSNNNSTRATATHTYNAKSSVTSIDNHLTGQIIDIYA